MTSFKKKLSRLMLPALAMCFFTAAASAYEVHDGPTGVIKYDKEKSYNGYTLFTPTEDNTVIYLIDMRGDIVHTWKTTNGQGSPFVSRLLPNGNLLVYTSMNSAPVKIGGYTGLIEELDWDGKVVWSHTMCSKNEVSHHAFDRMPNGNTLMLGWERVKPEEMLKRGRKPGFPKEILIRGEPTGDFWVDFVREIDPSGKTVWEWHVMDHVGTSPDQLDPNYILPKPAGPMYSSFDWTHFNTVEYIPGKDQVILNSRNFSESMIVDKKTGKIIFRWGNPSTHGQGARPSWFDDGSQKIFGSHHATLLDNGNLSIFDNGSERPEGNRSRVIEVDIKSGEIVWEYAANGYNSFYSHRQGAAQRLPNGNTLVTSTQQGHLFEVTPAKEVVWEFVSPIVLGKNVGIFSDGDHVSRNKKGGAVPNMFGNMIHRSYRYGPDFSGFKGKDLSPKGYIVEGYPRFFEVWKKQ